MTEAEYQANLVATILASPSLNQNDSGSISIYRNNWRENAHRALAVSFPTVQRLLGEDNFRTLCRYACQTMPKTQYDWGEWGVPDAFPAAVAAFIQAQDAEQLAYVADSAKLDAAVFMCQRTVDPDVDQQSLAKLTSEAADQLRLTTASALHLLTSSYPVHALFEYAHNQSGDIQQIQADINAVDDTSNPIMRYVLVSRSAFKPEVTSLSANEYALYKAALEGASIESLFAMASETDTDFSVWLGNAIAHAHIIGAEFITQE